MNMWEKNDTIDLNESNMMNCPTLISSVSHEMRTHMNAIIAFSFLMKEKNKNNPDYFDFSKYILNSCEQLISLFDNFLDTALLDTGDRKPEPGHFSINELMEDLIPEFSNSINNEHQKNVELITEFQINKSIEITTDRNMFLRIFRSLFQNSIINTESGYIKIGHYLDRGNLICYIIDSGRGYLKSKEFLYSEDISESLKQYNDIYSAINIALAKRLIQLMGGRLRIECNGISGTGIYFSFPAESNAETETELKINNKIVIAI